MKGASVVPRFVGRITGCRIPHSHALSARSCLPVFPAARSRSCGMHDPLASRGSGYGQCGDVCQRNMPERRVAVLHIFRHA
eukprot:6214325-Pleurochrysis_carterae.AAC.2